MKHLFILNPTAGSGRRTEQAKTEIARVMSAQGDDWELYETQGVLDAKRKVRMDADAGTPLRVYACGGDGTLNECVNGAAGIPTVAVTHYPTGTGNDFIKTFGAGSRHFFDLTSLMDAVALPIDLIDVSGRLGINICSVGFDARIASSVHRYKTLPLIGGKTAYRVSLFTNLLLGVGQRFTLEISGKTTEQDFTLICACNGKSYGGTFTPVPEAKPDDGLMEILLLKSVSRLAVANLVKRYAEGRYRELPQIIKHVQGDAFTVSARHKFPVNLDGEVLYMQEAVFRMLPGGVQFFAPRQALPARESEKTTNYSW